MNRQPVTSSNLRSVGYDSTSQVLEIEFHDGGIYQYFDVPSSVHASLLNAGSKGSYFQTFIKDRYRYRKIR
jgi:KTSC domain